MQSFKLSFGTITLA